MQQQPGNYGGGQQIGVWTTNGIAQMTSGIPPGLEYMAQVDQLLVHQQIELLEVLTNFEVRNKYQIKNTLGQQVYFASEESEFCHRQCCGRARGFNMHVTDNLNQEVFRIVRQFKCCSGCCWCANPDSNCSMDVQIEAPPGNVVAYVKQAQSGWRAEYVVQDANQQTVLRIRGPCCPCQTVCCTDDIDFVVTSRDGTQPIGRIAKQWGGFVREVFSRADNFCVQFPIDLDVKLKAALVGATFLIDYMLFERSKNE